VIVVSPTRLVAESPQGPRSLYVALTRATRRLVVVHDEDLPSIMGAP
jgi:DNA helicase IV